ncbi:MAG TPA: peptidylprolyl isomerase [Bacteroidales bacterium]|nr:peptidylprolyl isomerase [Bacteroidales bacterium]
MKQNILISIAVILFLSACKSNVPKGTRAEIKTTAGTITIVLYDQTPVHRDNFIKLAQSGFYNGVSFHRVIREFMIQTGDVATNVSIPESEKSKYEYYIPAEISDSLFHKRGVIAAAREGDDVNPARNSSGTQFYIVQGKKYTDADFPKMEQRIEYNRKQYEYYKLLENERARHKKAGDLVSDETIQQDAMTKYNDLTEKEGPYKLSKPRKDVYKTIGGTPFLDGSYTIFGEVLSGMDVVDAIASATTDMNDKPVKDIRILKVKILK